MIGEHVSWSIAPSWTVTKPLNATNWQEFLHSYHTQTVSPDNKGSVSDDFWEQALGLAMTIHQWLFKWHLPKLFWSFKNQQLCHTSNMRKIPGDKILALFAPKPKFLAQIILTVLFQAILQDLSDQKIISAYILSYWCRINTPNKYKNVPLQTPCFQQNVKGWLWPPNPTPDKQHIFFATPWALFAPNSQKTIIFFHTLFVDNMMGDTFFVPLCHTFNLSPFFQISIPVLFGFSRQFVQG